VATYAEHQAQRERAERRGRQDRFLAAQQSHFDADVAANTDKRGGWKRHKYERPSFAVVTASDAFRAGYDQINWNTPQAVEPGSNPAPQGNEGQT
jgi:hypothetical protein